MFYKKVLNKKLLVEFLGHTHHTHTQTQIHFLLQPRRTKNPNTSLSFKNISNSSITKILIICFERIFSQQSFANSSNLDLVFKFWVKKIVVAKTQNYIVGGTAQKKCQKFILEGGTPYIIS